jgi:hypothetical protein
MGKAERLAQHGNEFERNGKMSRPAGAMADEGVFDIFELAEDPPEELRDLLPGQVS